MNQLDLIDTPEELVGQDKTGCICVVVDILRATTTIQAAFAAGADQVWAMPDLDRAIALKAKQPELILAGERGGIAPQGFDLGNSPREISAAKIQGKTVVLTTTNGTRALAATRGAKQVITGCFLNANAVRDHLLAANRPCILACAGHLAIGSNLAEPSAEDRLFAGFLANELANHGFRLGANAKGAREEWMANGDQSLENRLIGCPHGQSLGQLGFALDIAFAAQWNTSAKVAHFIHTGDRNIWMGFQVEIHPAKKGLKFP